MALEDIENINAEVNRLLETATLKIRCDPRPFKEVAVDFHISEFLVQAVRGGESLWEFNDAYKILSKGKKNE